jgi:hypothetical protein
MPGFNVRMTRTSLSKLGRVKTQTIRAGREADYARRAAYNAGRQVRRLFERTTKTWEHPVKFNLRTTARGGTNFIAFEIQTSDEIWHWLDKGTNARYKASNPEDPYVSKTVTGGVFDSYAGSGSMIWNIDEEGNLSIMNGIEPRGWSTSKRLRRAAEISLRAQFDQQMSKFRRIMRGET